MVVSTGALLGSSAIGALGNIGGSFVSNAQSYSQSKKLMAMQAALNYYYAQKSAENSPTWNRKGLEDAGYNPMLAVQNATSGANSSWSGLNNSTASDYGNAISQGIANAQSFKHLENETLTSESTAKLNEAQSRSAVAEAIGKEIHNQYLPENEQKQLGKLGAEISKLNSESDYIDAWENRLDKELAMQQKVAEIGKSGVVYNANTLKEIADKHSPSGRSASFENYTKGVSNVLNGIGSVLHGTNNNYTETTDTIKDKNRTVSKRTRKRR